MKNNAEKPEFKYYLSAFLSAARSVLQYSFTEANKQHKKGWYEGQVTGNKILKFFKCQRNINIHRHSVRKGMTADITESVQVSDSLTITIRRSTVATYKEPPKSMYPEPQEKDDITKKMAFC